VRNEVREAHRTTRAAQGRHQPHATAARAHVDLRPRLATPRLATPCLATPRLATPRLPTPRLTATQCAIG
jgi:hypothetical protein